MDRMDGLSNLKLALYHALGGKTWYAVSHLGEVAVLFPAAILIGVLLWRAERVTDAVSWSLAIIGCAATVGLMKLAIGDFQWTVYGHTFNAKGFPSGHMAMATVFWGGLALLTKRRWSPLLLIPIPVVALTVLVLWWHHTLDIVAGAAIGAASLLPLLLRAPRRLLRSAS